MSLSKIMIVDWANLKKRLIHLFGREDIKEKIRSQGKELTQVLNYKFGDHIYNLFISFLGIKNIEDCLDRNIRILIYGAWDLDDKWFKRIISFLEGKKRNEYFDEDLIMYLWNNGILHGKGLKKLVSDFIGKENIEPHILCGKGNLFFTLKDTNLLLPYEEVLSLWKCRKEL